jgi:hypothetical protein
MTDAKVDTALLRKDKLVVNRKIFDLDFVKENHTIQFNDRRMDTPATNNYISQQQEMHRQNMEVNGQRGISSRTHREEDQRTQLWSQQEEMEGNRQSTQTDDRETRSATRGATDQPQGRAEDVNKATSANSETSADRRYNVQSWLTTPKDDASTKRKGARDVNSSTYSTDRVAGTLKIGFINTEGLKNKSQRKVFLDLLKVNEVFGIAESWAGSGKYKISGYRSENRGRCKKMI